MSLTSLDTSKDVYTRFRGLPFRDGQMNAIQTTLCDTHHKLNIIDAPTGVGKTCIGLVAGESVGTFNYLCSSKQLQDQISEEFPEVEVLYGRANYPCLSGGLNASDCLKNKLNIECSKSCVYRERKEKVSQHTRRVLNYAYQLAEANYVGAMPRPKIMIGDEADVLEGMLSNFVGVRVSTRLLDKLGVKPPKKAVHTKSERTVQSWIDWAGILSDKISAEIEVISNEIEDANDKESSSYRAIIEYLEELDKLNSKLGLFHRNVTKDWIQKVHLNSFGKISSWEFKPIWLTPRMMEEYYLRHADKHVLMSATWPNKQIIGQCLGVAPSDINMINVPSLFAPENRKVLFKRSGNMGYKTQDEDLPKMLAAIEKILAKHKGQKGVIHVGSYSLGWKIIKGLRSRRLKIHDGTNKLEVLSKFMCSDSDDVFVSPSSTRGIDLPDDLCRFSIVAKAPYLSLADEWVKTRVYSSGAIGQYWYTSMCSQEIIQSCGRGCRHQNDWVTNYILDENAIDLLLKGGTDLFPEYFMQAVHMARL